MDDDQPLTAESDGNTTLYLYGLGAIGEKTDAWSYSLPDGTNTPRQLSNLTGELTLSARYTPWGDTLDTYGTGNFTFGYFGGVMDAATGLLYVGNGQYYDPATGRFLTRGANPDSTNPYTPWNPIGAIVGPLGLISLFYTRKKKESKGGTWLVLLIVVVAVGITLSACGPQPPQPTPTPPVPPDGTPMPGPGTDTGGGISTPEPSSTPPAVPCPEPKNWLPIEFRITHYTISLETDPAFSGSYLVNVPISASPGGPVDYYNYQHNNAFIYGIPVPGTTSGYNYGVLQEGTGYTANNKYITIDTNQLTNNPDTNDFGRTVFTYTTGGACSAYGYGLEKDKTVATSVNNIRADLDFGCGDKFYIEGYGDTIFTITDSGSDVGDSQFDIFVGPMTRAFFEANYPEIDSFARVAKVKP